MSAKHRRDLRMAQAVELRDETKAWLHKTKAGPATPLAEADARALVQEIGHLHDIATQERDRLRALLNSITDEIWFADTEGQFTLTNPSACREFGLGAEEVVNVRQLAETLEVFRPDGSLRPIDEAPPLRALRGEVVRNLEEMIRTPVTGEFRHRQVSASPVRDAQRNIIGSVSVVRDITERKQMEASLRKAHDELERRVQERTAELAETVEELHEQIRERIGAEQSLQREHRILLHLMQAWDRERQAISLGIHDNLAQPLTSATMHLQAAEGLKSENPEAAAEAQSAGIAMLRASINEARRLIDGVRPPILEDEGVEAAIAHLAHESRWANAPQVELRIDAQFGRLAPTLESAIYHIAQEGFDNACRHSRSDRVRIELTQAGDRLRIEIQDWGVGFDPQTIKEEAFGLEEIRERARLLGGTTSIKSAPGKGTQIVADLPLLPSTPPAT